MKPQPKTVRAWCFAWRGMVGSGVATSKTRIAARVARATYSSTCDVVGPIVCRFVPAPKERKR